MVESPPFLRLLNASYAANPPRDDSMAEERRTTGSPLPAAEFERRKEFGCFTAADAALLQELREVFARHSDEVVDRFYSHLGSFDELRPLLSDEDSMQRLRGFQRDYLLSLASGRYDEAYAAQRRRIGQTHNRIGLGSQWYLGTYGLYLDILFPLIHQQSGRDVRRAMRGCAALAKLIILDMQLVLDAYYGIRQREAVERSEQLAAVGELAASIAHEVRNPLAGMRGALEVLTKDLQAENREIADELLAQIDRLEHLVRDLLTYARPRVLNRQPFDVHELLDRLIRRYREQFESPQVAVRRVWGPGTAQLVADPLQMEQVFLNLIHNALQAMPDGGELAVITRATPGGVEISFEDTGKGISPADLPKVQQPFFTTKHRGSGLGLPIVRKICEAHGGTLRIESQVGRGTSATVLIPYAEGR
jgi:two-component system sensor histidine kinase HydH